MSLTDSESNEIKFVRLKLFERNRRYAGIIQPYGIEPLDHTSNEDEDHEENQHGLFPVVLRVRF